MPEFDRRTGVKHLRVRGMKAVRFAAIKIPAMIQSGRLHSPTMAKAAGTSALWSRCLQGHKMRRPHPATWAVLTLFILLFSWTSLYARPLPSPAVRRQQEQAVLLARAGRPGEAADQLELLHRQWPRDRSITNDLIVLLTWAGRDDRAIRLFLTRPPAQYPDYVLFAVTNSYRNLHDPDAGLRILEDLLARHPGNQPWLLRKVLLLIDKGSLEPARKILADIARHGKKNRDFFLARAYLHEQEHKTIKALADYQGALTLNPADRRLLRRILVNLNHIRAPARACQLDTPPSPLTAEEKAALLTGRAAELLRWSTDAQEDFKETGLFAFKALALQLQALAVLPDQDRSRVQRRQVYLDMLITLRNLRRMRDLQSLYATLAHQGPMPDYTRQALADSLLASREPDRARRIYSELVDKDPGNYGASMGLFYSCVEDEDFDHAFTLIDSMIRHEPRYRTFWDTKAKFPNERYLSLQVTGIQARFYADQLGVAWDRIDALVNRAPANNWLYEVRGQIENARGWPRQALDDFRTASLLRPDSLDAIAGKGASLIQLHRYDEVRPILAGLLRDHPHEHVTRSLARDYRFARKPSYWGDITFSHSSGPELNGDGMLATAELISPPIDDNWYLNAGFRHAWSELIEGEETFDRTALGLEYHRGNWDILGHLTYNNSTRREMGGTLKAIYQPSDFWRFMVSGERFAADTPLRALYHDIRADAVSTAVTYRASERRQLTASLRLSDFTDNNTRIEAGAGISQRLVDIPHLDIDGRLELYGSTNAKTDVPYYSPDHDLSFQGAIHIDHVYYRHYDHLLAQQLDIGYGFYDQEGYVPRWIGHIRYEHRYRFTPWLEALAGVEFGQNVYDGHAEPYRMARFMINGKF